MTVRKSARAVVVNNRHQILLMKVRDVRTKESRNSMPDEFWTTLGGGLDDGESYEDALRREIFEESGITSGVIEGWIWTRDTRSLRHGSWVDQHEQFYLFRTDQGRVTQRHQSIGERDDFLELKWWDLDELEASSDAFTPVVLPRTLRAVLARKHHQPVSID